MVKKELHKFSWNSEVHIYWLKTYIENKPLPIEVNQNLISDNSIFKKGLFGAKNNDKAVKNDKQIFESISIELSKNSEGREWWKKLTGAWNKKNRRDANKNVKSYSFELHVDVQKQLKYLAKGSSSEDDSNTKMSIRETLENLILGHYKEEQNLREKKILKEKNTLENIEISKLKHQAIELEKLLSEEKEKVKQLELKIEKNTVQYNDAITPLKKQQSNNSKNQHKRKSKGKKRNKR